MTKTLILEANIATDGVYMIHNVLYVILVLFPNACVTVLVCKKRNVVLIKCHAYDNYVAGHKFLDTTRKDLDHEAKMKKQRLNYNGFYTSQQIVRGCESSQFLRILRKRL